MVDSITKGCSCNKTFSCLAQMIQTVFLSSILEILPLLNEMLDVVLVVNFDKRSLQKHISDS